MNLNRDDDSLTLLTFERRPLWEDGDGALCRPLLVPHRVDLGAPRVGADPVEVARLAAPHRRREQLPGIDGNRSDMQCQSDREDDGNFFSRIEAA